jgi:hypothetical protein
MPEKVGWVEARDRVAPNPKNALGLAPLNPTYKKGLILQSESPDTKYNHKKETQFL